MNIVIIGATKGLGLCLTEKLLEKGHKVAAGVLSISPGLTMLEAKYSGRLFLFNADVTNEEQIAAGAEKCRVFLGKIDALCNVAGVLLEQDRVKLLHECDISELRKSFDVNAVGPVIVVKNFYPYLKAGANVFTVTSEGVGITNCGTWVPCYALSKAAATKVSGILNASIEEINFYSVHPGRMNTDMGYTTAQIEPEEAAEGFCKLIDGGTQISRDNWYINYNGESMES